MTTKQAPLGLPHLKPYHLLPFPSSCCDSIRAQLLTGRPGESQLLQHKPGDPGAAVHHLPSFHQVSPAVRPPPYPHPGHLKCCRQLYLQGLGAFKRHRLLKALAPEQPGPTMLPDIVELLVLGT